MALHACKFAWIITVSCSLASLSLAGVGPNKMASVRIQTIATFQPHVAGQGEILNYLTRWFESRGVKVVDHAEWVLSFNALPMDHLDTARVLLSIGLGFSLPKDVIDEGKEAEMFFSFLPASKRASFPKEGKWVREQITENFLYQFIYPLDEKLVLVDREKLLQRLEELVKELCGSRLEG